MMMMTCDVAVFPTTQTSIRWVDDVDRIPIREEQWGNTWNHSLYSPFVQLISVQRLCWKRHRKSNNHLEKAIDTSYW